LDNVGLLVYYLYEWEAKNDVGLKLSTMKDISLHIQDDRLTWMKMIERNDHRLMKAVSCLVDQRHDGHLTLLWTQDRHLLNVFEALFGWTLMTELVQATNIYYSTVEGFLTRDPLLLNLRCMAGHIMRERHMVYGSILG